MMRRFLALGLCLAGIFVGIGPVSASVPVSRPAIPVTHLSAAAVVNEINALRAKFHLPTGRSTTAYQALVNSAAAGLRDPVFRSVPAGILAEYGVWGAEEATGGAALDPKGIVHTWVYSDGWKGASTMNVDCTSPRASGCNDHRRYVLSGPPVKGSQLAIDVAAISTVADGNPAVSVAVILAWSAPTPAKK